MDSWAKLELGVAMTVLGMGIVFTVLVFLAFVLSLLKTICSPPPPKAQEQALTAHSPAAAPGDAAALVAVIAAAVSACTGVDPPARIHSIRRAGEELPVWSRRGRLEQMASRKIR